MVKTIFTLRAAVTIRDDIYQILVQNWWKEQAYQIIALSRGSVIIIICFQIRRKQAEIVLALGNHQLFSLHSFGILGRNLCRIKSWPSNLISRKQPTQGWIAMKCAQGQETSLGSGIQHSSLKVSKQHLPHLGNWGFILCSSHWVT